MIQTTTKQIVQKMFFAGVHIGHKKNQRNPKMIPYIYTEKEGLQIIDLFKTYQYLKSISLFLFNSSRQGKRVLFVGTKKQVTKCVEEAANDCNSWYVNRRWLGGLLTNWSTMRKSISKIQTNIKIVQKSKKKEAEIEKQKKHLIKYFDGIKTMQELPDIVIIIGQHKEINAVKECKKLKIPSITILDTNCDPSLTDFFIPANDDSLASVSFILNQLSNAIKQGQKKSNKKKITTFIN